MAKIENRSFEEVHDIYAKYLTPQQIKRVDSSYELAKKNACRSEKKVWRGLYLPPDPSGWHLS